MGQTHNSAKKYQYDFPKSTTCRRAFIIAQTSGINSYLKPSKYLLKISLFKVYSIKGMNVAIKMGRPGTKLKINTINTYKHTKNKDIHEP